MKKQNNSRSGSKDQTQTRSSAKKQQFAKQQQQGETGGGSRGGTGKRAGKRAGSRTSSRRSRHSSKSMKSSAEGGAGKAPPHKVKRSQKSNNSLKRADEQSYIDDQVEGDLQNVLNQLDFDNQDDCMLEMDGKDSMGALSALIHHQQQVIEKVEDDANALGQATLAGYISDSVEATPQIQIAATMSAGELKNFNQQSLKEKQQDQPTSRVPPASRSRGGDIINNLDSAIDEILGQSFENVITDHPHPQQKKVMQSSLSPKPHQSIGLDAIKKFKEQTTSVSPLHSSSRLPLSAALKIVEPQIISNQYLKCAPYEPQQTQPSIQKITSSSRVPPPTHQGYHSFGSDEEIFCPAKKGASPAMDPDDERNEWQGSFEWDDEVDRANKEVFGNENFRENQREIINATKSGKDVLALIPTGGGKSLTFQLSAVTGDGVTVVVMPLLSLIEDNLNFVLELDIPACSLSVGNTQKEDKKIGHLYSEIKQMRYKIVYLTPEKIVKSPGLISTIDELYAMDKIDRFVIDEVHCVSHWGQDFRKDYLHLDILKKRFAKVPILGLTATATQKVKDDIASRLGITNKVIYFQSSFNRPNLLYEIRDKKQIKDIDQDVKLMLRSRFKDKCGIIYCISRKDCERLSESLKRNFGIKCDFYHAELPYARRQEIQRNWMNNEIQVIIATIAFGMGINKRDVRFVIHYSMPKSLEGYVQECGRAGRDQKKAECILYYQYGDRKLNDFFICQGGGTGVRKKENLHALYSILEYCEEPHLCRRMMQLQFLGEAFSAEDCMAMCDNCRAGKQVVQQDLSNDSLALIRCVQEINDCQGKITSKQLVDLVKGKLVKSVYLRKEVVEKHQGLLKHMKEQETRRLIIKMLILGCLEEIFVSLRRGNSGNNIAVYVGSGKNAGKLEKRKFKVLLSHGVDKGVVFNDTRIMQQLSSSQQQYSNYPPPISIPVSAPKPLFPQAEYSSHKVLKSQQELAVLMGGGHKEHVQNLNHSMTSQYDDELNQMDTSENRVISNNSKHNTSMNKSSSLDNREESGNQNLIQLHHYRSKDDEQMQTSLLRDYESEVIVGSKNNQNHIIRGGGVGNVSNNTMVIDSVIKNKFALSLTSCNNNIQTQRNSGGNQYEWILKLDFADESNALMEHMAEASHQQSGGGVRPSITSQNMSFDSNALYMCKPITESPKFSETLQEELRSRLLLIKLALQNSQSDTEFARIQKAFTSKSMKIFLNLVNVSQQIEQEKINQILIDRLKEGASGEIEQAIEKYGEHFIAEFTHFLRIHGFIKKINNTVVGGAQAPQSQMIGMQQEQMQQLQQQEQKLIQQNNFFQIQASPCGNQPPISTKASQPQLVVASSPAATVTAGISNPHWREPQPRSNASNNNNKTNNTRKAAARGNSGGAAIANFGFGGDVIQEEEDEYQEDADEQLVMGSRSQASNDEETGGKTDFVEYQGMVLSEENDPDINDENQAQKTIQQKATMKQQQQNQYSVLKPQSEIKMIGFHKDSSNVQCSSTFVAKTQQSNSNNNGSNGNKKRKPATDYESNLIKNSKPVKRLNFQR